MTRKLSRIGTFGTHLQHFARSVDIVDNQIFNDTRQLVFEYLQEQLDASYFELMVEHMVNETKGLQTIWSSANQKFANEIRNRDGEYNSLAALCYAECRPLWIVGDGRAPLRSAARCTDMWSGLTDLPRYRSPVERDLFTSVVVPIRRPGDRVLGVMNVESSRYLDIADFERQELDVLADALGVLLDLRQMHEVQALGTADALDNLRKMKDAVVFPQIAKPQVFVAFSARADEHVVGVLKEVLDEQGDLRVLPWDQIDASGKVTVQIEDTIAKSQFGVCYLSEPDGSGAFRDNTNVLFEAGMLNARSMSAQEPAAWLPIREENSPPLSFDIAGDRIAYVPRANGRLNEQMFRAHLRSRLQQLKAGGSGGFR